jgi:hypothetical protein
MTKFLQVLIRRVTGHVFLRQFHLDGNAVNQEQPIIVLFTFRAGERFLIQTQTHA